MQDLIVNNKFIELNNWGKDFRKKLKSGRKFSYCFAGGILLLNILLNVSGQIFPGSENVLYLFSALIFLFGFLYGHYHDNFIYEEVAPGTYRAVLRGKGIGKLDYFQKKELLKQIFEDEDKIEIQKQISQKSDSALLGIIIFLIFLVCLMIFLPLTRKVICTHLRDNIYKCGLQEKPVFNKSNVFELGTVTKALAAGSAGQYQLQFHTIYNTNISYTMWTGPHFLPSKRAYEINKMMARKKDFTYDMINEIFIAAVLVLVILSVFTAVKQTKWKRKIASLDFFSSERYKAILKAEGLDTDIKPSAEISGPVIEFSEDDELTEMQKEFYDKNDKS